MNTQSDRHTWFVLLDGQRRGPLAYDDLARAAKEGLISADTPVWRAGWKNWHPARSVKGLVIERGPAMDRQGADRQIAERQAVERQAPERRHERPVIEAPLAPDDTGWTDDQGRVEEDYHYAPQQHREVRRPQQHVQSQDSVALRWEQPPDEDKRDHIFAEEWRGVLAEQDQRSAPDRGNTVVKANVPARIGRRPGTLDIDDVADLDYRPVPRGAAAGGKPSAIGAFLKRATMGIGAVLLLGVGGWVLVKSGALPKQLPGKTSPITAPDLPPAVASVPAVIALQRNDPDAFERFKKRYLDSAASHGSRDAMTLTRNALRKSVKHLLAISSGDVLLDITETSVAYMQGLQASSPESCVWLGDDNKGAGLKSNLDRDFPGPFNREMLVLERIAGTNPHMAIAPMSDAEALPYFKKVFDTMGRQNLRSDLQARERLDPSEFGPYCALVIAFYQAVLELPREDKINVLRNLYAKAAENADADLNPQQPTRAGMMR